MNEREKVTRLRHLRHNTLIIPPCDWQHDGEHGGVDDDPQSFLTAQVIVNGMLFFVAAIEVTSIVEGVDSHEENIYANQVAVDPHWQDCLLSWYHACSPPTTFNTVTVCGREYVLMISPQCGEWAKGRVLTVKR